jgi:peroxiredoxin Q/BCP
MAKKKISKKKSVKKKTKKTAAKSPKKVLKKASQKDWSLAPGDRAPDFMIPSDVGTLISLSSYPGKKVVLYFYPKDDTPGCTQESCDFRDSFSRLSKQDVVVLGASRDSVAKHVRFKLKYSLPFILLSDEDGTLCELYGVWKEKLNYGKKYMGIERTTFLMDVDQKGKATITHVYPKVKVKGHVDEILKAIKK